MFSSQIQKHVLCLSIYIFFCYWRLLCAVQVEMKQTIEQKKTFPHGLWIPKIVTTPPQNGTF